MSDWYLGFLYKKFPYIRPAALYQWFKVPQFVVCIKEMQEEGLDINERTVYPVMLDIYNELVKNRKVSDRYHFRDLRRVLHKVELSLKVPSTQFPPALRKDYRSKEGFD